MLIKAFQGLENVLEPGDLGVDVRAAAYQHF
jgi:hypothetical protein